MKKRLKVVGLDCPVCAGELEGLLQQIEGVQSVSVVFVQERVTVEVDNVETLRKVIATVNGFENARIVTEAESKRPRGMRFLLRLRFRSIHKSLI